MKLIKLSKTGWLIITGGVLVIAIAILGTIFFQQIQQQTELDEELIKVQTVLGKTQTKELVSQKTDLEAQLGEATSQRGILQNMLSSPIKSSTVTRTLFDIAEGHGLEVVEMTSSVPSRGNLEGVDFSLVLLTARVEGNAPNIIDFIIDLNSHFSTGIIRSVHVTIPDNSTEEKAAVDVSFVVYTLGG